MTEPDGWVHPGEEWRAKALSGVVVVTGTGTEVGKTVTTAAMASLAVGGGAKVAAVKIVQTGVEEAEVGDLAVIERLTGPGSITAVELARYPDPVAPGTASRRSEIKAPAIAVVVEAVRTLSRSHDLVLVEGSGGVLVALNEEGETVGHLAQALDAPAVVVAHAGLGTLNATALTLEALANRRIRSLGVVLGSWPARPDLATRCNVLDLGAARDGVVGAIPEGSGALGPTEFEAVARTSLGPVLGGVWDGRRFAARWGA